MARICYRAALAIFVLLSGGTMMGLGMTSIARSTRKTNDVHGGDDGRDFDARLKSLERR